VGYTATVLAGNTFVDAPHGLGSTPSITDLYVTPADDLEGRTFWTDTPTPTTFRINIMSQDTKNHVFNWFYSGSGPPLTGAVTVDSFGLKCQFLSDDLVLVASDFDEWSAGQVMKTRKVYGAKGVWKLSCFEGNVAWASSAAKYLRDKAESGGTVVLTINWGDRFTLGATTCYVTGIATDLALTGGKNLRHFTVTFREV
jgi:hypothetical protein